MEAANPSPNPNPNPNLNPNPNPGPSPSPNPDQIVPPAELAAVVARLPASLLELLEQL